MARISITSDTARPVPAAAAEPTDAVAEVPSPRRQLLQPEKQCSVRQPADREQDRQDAAPHRLRLRPPCRWTSAIWSVTAPTMMDRDPPRSWQSRRLSPLERSRNA